MKKIDQKTLEKFAKEKNIDKNKILAKKASYDYERGKTVIGVEIYVDGFEYDVELDAMTGAVQKWNWVAKYNFWKINLW